MCSRTKLAGLPELGVNSKAWSAAQGPAPSSPWLRGKQGRESWAPSPPPASVARRRSEGSRGGARPGRGRRSGSGDTGLHGDAADHARSLRAIPRTRTRKCNVPARGGSAVPIGRALPRVTAPRLVIGCSARRRGSAWRHRCGGAWCS